MAKELQIQITIKGTETEIAKLTELERELIGVGAELKRLTEASKVSEGAMKASAGRITELNETQRRLRQEVAATKKEIDLKRLSQEKLGNSYNDLTQRNKLLSDELRKLQDPLGTNKKRFTELSTEINNNTNKLKEMDGAMGRQFRNVGNYEGAIKNVGTAFAKMGAIIGGAILIVNQISNAVGSSIRAFDEEAKAQKALETALGFTSEALIKQSAALQKTTLFADDQVLAAQSMLAIHELTEDQILKLTPVILDFAQAQGISAADAAEKFGKSISTSTNALSRQGIEIEGAAGSSERLQSAIDNTTKKFAGQAEAAVTGAGVLQQFKNIVGDLQEKIGEFIVGAITPFIQTFSDIVIVVTDMITPMDGAAAATVRTKEQIEKARETIRETIETIIGFAKAIGIAVAGFVTFTLVANGAKIAAAAYTIIVNALSVAKAALTGGLRAATIAMQGFNTATKANIVGAVIALVVTLISAFSAFGKGARDAAEGQREFNAAQEEGKRILTSIESIETRIKTINKLNKEQLKNLRADIDAEIKANEAKEAIIISLVEKNGDKIKTLKEKLKNETNQINKVGIQIELNAEIDRINNLIKNEEGLTISQINQNKIRLSDHKKTVEEKIKISEGSNAKDMKAQAEIDLLRATTAEQRHKAELAKEEADFLEKRNKKDISDKQIELLQEQHKKNVADLNKKFQEEDIESTIAAENQLTQIRIDAIKRRIDTELEEFNKLRDQRIAFADEEVERIITDMQAQADIDLINAETAEQQRLAEVAKEDADFQERLNKKGLSLKQIELLQLQHKTNINSINKKFEDLERERVERELAVISNSFGQIGGLMKKGTAEQKIFASLQALINTYLAASQVMADVTNFTPIGKAIAVASMIALGFANIVKINAIQAKGGMRIPGIYDGKDDVPALLSRGEVVLNPVQQQRLGGASAFRAAGVPGFQGGGIALPSRRFISTATQQEFAFNSDLFAEKIGDRISETLASQRVVVVESDITASQRTIELIESEARL